MKTVETPPLDRLLEPLARKLTPTAARSIIEFRADPATQSRIAELAEKCNEGKLTAAEREEYEEYVRGIELIAILQSKARRSLRKSQKR